MAAKRQRVLLLYPRESQRVQLEEALCEAGYEVELAFEARAARVFLADPRSSFDAVVCGWPDQDPSAVDRKLGLLCEPAFDQIPVLVLAAALRHNVVEWVKQRTRCAMLAWEDLSDCVAAIEGLQNAPVVASTTQPEYEEQAIRVLFVDDSPTVRTSFHRLLTRQGFAVHNASSVAEGMEAALTHRFDLAIIDYFMPHQNGVELVRKLRANERTAHMVPAIVTGTYSDKVIEQSLAAGAVECIFKNEARDLFLARINSLARGILVRRSIENERRRLQGILSSVGDGVYGVDTGGVIEFVNPAASEILGIHDCDALIGQKAHELFHDRFEDGKPMPEEACFLSRAYASGTQVTAWQTTFFHASGRQLPVECTIYPLDIDGQREGSVVAFRDISERKQLEEELRWQATHDSLTKLINRSQFENELEQEVIRVRRAPSERASALLFLDIDRFKYVNDTAGHAAGDKLLIEVAHRLKDRLRSSDSLARIGGDEYAIILRQIRPGMVGRVAEQIRQSLENMTFVYGGKQYLISVTIGAALVEAHTPSPGEVMANADIACHLAKSRGRNRVHLFSAENDQKVTMDLEVGWSTRLKRALDEDRFVLAFQPIVPIQDEISLTRWPEAKRDAYEVLIRLEGSDDDLITSEAFLPTAERFNLMAEIDRWVIDEAFRRLAEQKQAGRDLLFSLNVSEQSLRDVQFCAFVKDRLAEYRLDGRQIAFEISEQTMLANLDSVRHAIRALRERGCSFGFDDFGSGFASFAQLKQLDVDFLKIDGSFLRGIEDAEMEKAVLSAIAALANRLGRQTIAECVDRKSSFEALRKAGINYAQGFYFAPPSTDIAPQRTLALVAG